MRSTLLVFALAMAATAGANPFDAFIGSYRVVGHPVIRTEHANFCNRFDFRSLTGFEVKADTHGFKQSHQLSFLSSAGSFDFPVMDYFFQTDLDPEYGSYAKTSGSGDTAVSEFGTFARAESRKVIVAITKKGDAYDLTASEEILAGRGTLSSGCYYQATLADDAQLKKGRANLESHAGCYLVDYSFVETEALKPGYVLDQRVYDINRDKAVKEWIYSEEISATRLLLQHVLFATDAQGKLIPGFMIKHTGEDWEYGAPFLYDYKYPATWDVKDLRATPQLWTRRIVGLDGGLRYQCAASWDLKAAYPEWSCDTYAPMTRREYGDMGRADYQALQRSSRVISYGANWLERESNIKTIEADGVRTPLAKEAGKIWYVRLPDAECAAAQAFAKPRLAFWNLLRETWDKVFTGDRAFIEKPIPGQSRYRDLMKIEEQFQNRDLSDRNVRNEAQEAILKVIQKFRE